MGGASACATFMRFTLSLREAANQTEKGKKIIKWIGKNGQKKIKPFICKINYMHQGVDCLKKYLAVCKTRACHIFGTDHFVHYTGIFITFHYNLRGVQERVSEKGSCRI